MKIARLFGRCSNEKEIESNVDDKKKSETKLEEGVGQSFQFSQKVPFITSFIFLSSFIIMIVFESYFAGSVSDGLDSELPMLSVLWRLVGEAVFWRSSMDTRETSSLRWRRGKHDMN